MASLTKDVTLEEYTNFIDAVYRVPNDRYYTLWDMLTNIQRFSMRAIKGVRKDNKEKAKTNLLIALSWFTSLMNRLHVDVAEIVWHRFPYLCSYCGKQPCTCKSEKIRERREVIGNDLMKPTKMEQYQVMFDKIYPAKERTKEDAAIHFAEETGELAEAFHIYMGDRSDDHFKNVELEAADYFSCVMGVLTSINISCADEVARLFSNNCHACHNAPCTCSFQFSSEYKS